MYELVSSQHNIDASLTVSEAVSQYVSHSAVCYAYLADVDLEKANFAYSSGSAQPPPKATQYQAFLRHSRWLTRGWTLQELIAPNKTVFYDKLWRELGNTSVPTLQLALADLTGIETSLLHDRKHAFTLRGRQSRQVVRDQISPLHQPVNEWRKGDGSWKDDVSMINATILKQSPSSTLCLDDDGQFDVLAARPRHCWDNRRRRFFVLGNLNSRRDLMPRGSLQLQFTDSTAEKFYVSFSQARFGGRYSIELSTKEDVETGAPGTSKSKYSSARLTLPESKRTVSATFLEGDGTVQGHDVLVMSPNLFPASKMIRCHAMYPYAEVDAAYRTILAEMEELQNLARSSRPLDEIVISYKVPDNESAAGE
ncbi:uncharacterized protein RHO25_009098 [Cercospora beticola]|uniref:Heterokaryon incompatibility domain-containing protein n=1 Tax=Cercospora beticola TaxID=122368 RepID=A0ABZ0NXW9_CERBT|nr:hypothetical protein RHO25_009098 [Cercospora beticola]